jgi:hypothetical protein
MLFLKLVFLVLAPLPSVPVTSQNQKAPLLQAGLLICCW